MMNIWSKLVGTGPEGPDYWEYFGLCLAERAGIHVGSNVIDVGCGCGSSLFPSAEKVGQAGRVTGIDICPH
jgi:O-methyltransferase/aklanonic acid methyltransferase